MSSILNSKIYDKERLTLKQKEANDFAYFKEKIDHYDREGRLNTKGHGGIDERKRMKVNYDLFNGKMDMKELAYVCSPFGADMGDLPAKMTHKDIASYRIKALLGMEMRRAFGYTLMATNSEATTRKEQEEAKRIRDYVISGIMKPIQQEIELKYQEQTQGRKLSPEEQKQIQEQIAAELQAQTPPEVKKYMQRDHQDPSEVQGNQIIKYLIREQDLRKKCNNGFKHAMLSAYEVYWTGIVRNKPVARVVNPMRFDCDLSPDLDFIEDGEFASYEFRMAPSEVVKTFTLTNDEIDSIYKLHDHYQTHALEDRLFTGEEFDDSEDDINTIRVKHVEWKGLRKVGWLDYIDAEGELQTKFLVNEDYKLDLSIGDIKIEWEWIPATFQGYRIGTDIYKNMGPVEGQVKDLDNLYNCKLSYIGAVYDNTNSEPTSPMDRMKVDQWYYDMLWYRVELLTASDKGKKIMMNIKAIPDSEGIDIEQFQYFMESTPFMWYNPDEEGMNQSDVNTIAKILDLSLASDIAKYIEMAREIEQRCGKTIGVTDPVLGQTAVSERVGNNQQNLVQTSHMLEPYFDLHSAVKKNLIQALLDKAKIAYTNAPDQIVLSYALDDMGSQMFKIDKDLLSNNTLAMFIEDSSMAEEAKQTVRQLAHAAMQNQRIELSDVLAVIKQSSVQEAEESLKIAEDTRAERDNQAAEAERKFKAEEAQKERDENALEHKREIEKIVVKATEDRKTQIQKQAILSAGFNEDKDFDDDGELDVMEIAREGVAAQLAISKDKRESRELDHRIEDDKEKNKIAKKSAAKTSS